MSYYSITIFCHLLYHCTSLLPLDFPCLFLLNIISDYVIPATYIAILYSFIANIMFYYFSPAIVLLFVKTSNYFLHASVYSSSFSVIYNVCMFLYIHNPFIAFFCELQYLNILHIILFYQFLYPPNIISMHFFPLLYITLQHACFIVFTLRFLTLYFYFFDLAVFCKLNSINL